jgi:hypothetical protein
MSAEAQLYSALAGASGVTALVGARIYPVEAPPGPTQPYAVYQRIATESVVTHGQPGASTPDHLDGCHFQVTAVASTMLEAISIIYQVRIALEKSAALSAAFTDERSLPRDDSSNTYAHSADFIAWLRPE